MKSEQTITICGKEVTMRYCAAAETGFERITGRSISCFVPTIGPNEDGKMVILEPATATNEDYMMLAAAAITAYYLKNGQESPLTTNDILYDAKPTEVSQLINAVAKARNAWYEIPEVVQEKLDEEKAEQESSEQEKADGGQKNA